jgi:hypothetical protein
LGIYFYKPANSIGVLNAKVESELASRSITAAAVAAHRRRCFCTLIVWQSVGVAAAP